MTSINKFYFLNHASFAIERDKEILLLDPWYEGAAFNNGWALLDKSTTNESVIEWLRNSNKTIYIWYSHEHSDHLSMSFLKLIKRKNVDVKIIYQQTLDGRVRDFLRNQQFDVLDADEGCPIELGIKFSITTWQYRDGDSFCLILTEDKSLLNINDCVISNVNDAISVRNKVHRGSQKLDVLLTQFGYANWIGNEEDTADRVSHANRQIDSIRMQEKILTPLAIIPFASFMYFCHIDNFYLNDAQNSPKSVIAAERLELISEKIFFMKPWDMISLNGKSSIQHQLILLSSKAIDHWENLKNTISPISIETKQTEITQLEGGFLKFRKRMSLNFAFLPQFFELLKIIRPINILITDINKVVTLSYLKGITVHIKSRKWHIAVSSEVLNFIFQNDFGFNTTHVNGRFRLGQDKKISDAVKFFIVQEFYKNGFGIRRPFVSGKHLTSKIVRLVSKKLIKPT